MLPTNKLPDKLLGQVSFSDQKLSTISSEQAYAFFQVYQFLQQIRVCPVCIGVAGFFHINGKLLNSVRIFANIWYIPTSYSMTIRNFDALLDPHGSRILFGRYISTRTNSGQNWNYDKIHYLKRRVNFK